jgi:methionine-S-sulfoxide reductase
MDMILIATFAGGCFWCMQPPYDHLKGVVRTTVGYMGGQVPSPTYEQISTGKTGHYEVIQIEYNSQEITYDDLLNVYWKNVDPTDEYGQFADLGPQYQPVIFYHNDAQKIAAEKSKAALEKSKKFNRPIVVKIKSASPFYTAEGYHQQYYLKNPIRYNQYKKGSGRADFIERNWR